MTWAGVYALMLAAAAGYVLARSFDALDAGDRATAAWRGAVAGIAALFAGLMVSIAMGLL